MKKYPFVIEGFPHILHGGDYNPEQWIESPEIWDEDMRLMKLANVNVVSIGIFSWSELEKEDGVYDFSFLDTIMDKLADNGIKAILATPSGARPPWLAMKYPEVNRTDAYGHKMHFGGRHNHCFTSPIYRKKVYDINRRLAERYKNHPSLGMWHVSNEYSGECFCPLCQEAFKAFLKKKYHNSLDELNHAWWSRFWSHKFTDWSQIEAPSPLTDDCLHGRNLDWKRFVTEQTVDFMKNEILPLRQLTPNVPVTTNMMGAFQGLNYREFTKELDVVSWDSYPMWHDPNQLNLAAETAFLHDLNRGLKQGKPFLLMESTPSTQNWAPTNKLKKPKVHTLSSVQAIAHGSDSVQYFQWRKGRGACEQYHGAVVDHCGHEHTRVFNDVSKLGLKLKTLDDICGTYVDSKVAIVYNWENNWAIDDIRAMKSQKKDYQQLCMQYYTAFWKLGINVDIIDMTDDISKYDLLVLPMLYMLKDGVAHNIMKYVENGGTVVASYLLGQVDENNLCHLGGFPGDGLRKVFGIWNEELECLYDNEIKHTFVKRLGKEYEIKDYCELIHTEGAQVLATYNEDFFEGMPSLTVNKFGKGTAYYIAFRDTGEFSNDFFAHIVNELNIPRVIDTEFPSSVTAHSRTDGLSDYIFVENYSDESVTLEITNCVYKDLFDENKSVSGQLSLQPYDIKVLKKAVE